MKKKFVFILSLIILSIIIPGFLKAQNVGIGTSTPTARLHVSEGSVLFSSIIGNNPGMPPAEGSGRRMMWYADKAAFRAGSVSGANWDKDSIGNYSFAAGDDNKAKGAWSTAMGGGTVASGDYSTAMGSFSKAIGDNATAIGKSANASGDYSAAIGLGPIASGFASTSFGYYTTASGSASTAMGQNTFAIANNSTAIGTNTTASGISSVAIGSSVKASGDKSFAMGYRVNTNDKAGAFFFGDSDPNNKGVRPIGMNNQFAARFNGGYYFITSDAGSDIGVQVPAGGNSWSTISDINRKENFLPVDGESFLQKISKLHFTTWNYKGQDAKTFRHYGPMAQDFYKAFGKDDLGTIGCDTLINQQDFLGVNLIAIQALEKRTTMIMTENEKQEAEIEKLKKENIELKARLLKLEKLLIKTINSK